VIWAENLKRRDQVADGRIILRFVLRKQVVEGVDWIHMAQNKVHWRGSSEHGNELQGYING
jgi:hypothetical protein